MKKKVLALTLGLTMALSLAACGGNTGSSTSGSGASSGSGADASTSGSGSSGDLITVGFAQVGHESDWRTASTQSAQDVFSEENGYQLSFIDCDNDSATQLEAVRGFIQQGVDYIIIDPIVSTGWDAVLTECEDAGIPVIVIDRTIDDSDKYVTWVGSDFKTEGLACGEWLKAYAEAKGITEINALVIEGSTGASATIGRTRGFNEVAKVQRNWNILQQVDGEFTTAKGKEEMARLLDQYEDIDVVVSQNDDMTFGALEAIREAGKTAGVDGDITVISFDAVDAGVELVRNGEINIDVQCNPDQGKYVEQIIQDMEDGKEIEKAYYVPERVYTQENVGEEENVTEGISG